jgi:GT2 family glycosyltransferase
MELSIVLACYNGAETLSTQLDALARQSWSELWEVIVSDNGSTDTSRQIAETYRGKIAQLRVVDSSGARGIAHARNVGAAFAGGKTLAFCDQDDEVSTGWVEAMGEALKRHDFVAGSIELEKLNEPWARKYRGAPQADELMYFWRDRSFFPVAFGCTLGVKHELFDAVGGLDESFARDGDEVDLCWRIQCEGIALQFIPAAVVHYRCRHSFGAIFHQACHYGEADVNLYAKWRSKGLGDAQSLPRQLAAAFKPFVRLLPRSMWGKADRARLIWEVGFLTGRIRGSAANCILLLHK